MTCRIKNSHKNSISRANFARDIAADIWLSSKQVSDVTGKNQAGVREACADRNGKYRGGVYVFRKIGKAYEILLSSLSEEHQAKYYLKQRSVISTVTSQSKREDLTLKTPQNILVPNRAQNTSLITHTQEDFESIWQTFYRKTKSLQDKANYRLGVLDEYHMLLESDIKKDTALKVVCANNSYIGRTTLWRWLSLVEGLPRIHWLPFLLPQNIGRSIDEIPPIVWDEYSRLWLHDNQRTAEFCYREAIKLFNPHNGEKLPCLKTFQRRMDIEVPQEIQQYARMGKKYNKNSQPHQRRDRTTLRLHEVWSMDGHVANCFVRWPDGTKSRPHITALMDVASNTLVGYKVYDRFNAEVSIETLTFAMKKMGTIPEVVYPDNGRDFASKAFSGGQSFRNRFTIKEDDPLGITTRLGIKVKFATVAHGQAKPIERFFKGIDDVCKIFDGAYTGNNPKARPESFDDKKLPSVEAFCEKLNEYITYYHNRPSNAYGFGLNTPNDKIRISPMQMFEKLFQNYIPTPLTDQQLNACRPFVKRLKLSNQLEFEITLPAYGKVIYQSSQDLNLKRGNSYDILPLNTDPTQPALIYDGVRYIGEAHYKHRIPFLSQSVAKDTMQARRHRQKDNKQKLALSKGEVRMEIEHESILQKLPANQHIKSLPAAQPSLIAILENGDIRDNATGEVTKVRVKNLELLNPIKTPLSEPPIINENNEEWLQDLIKDAAKVNKA